MAARHNQKADDVPLPCKEISDVWTIDEQFKKKSAALAKKANRGELNFQDYLEFIDRITKKGLWQKIIHCCRIVMRQLRMVERIIKRQKKKKDDDTEEEKLLENADKEHARFRGIIQAMTLKERLNPSIIDLSRRKRIAEGSGVSVKYVNELLQQFQRMNRKMKGFSKKTTAAHQVFRKYRKKKKRRR
jgi:signal recognition particle subunit SRP54